MAQMANLLPNFFNHLDSGVFLLTDTTKNNVNLECKKISSPQGIIVYSNAFDITTAKADKPMLGAYAAFYIAGVEQLPLQDNVNYLNKLTMYAVNWGQGTSQEAPVWRSSRTETRGIRYWRPSNRTFNLLGFGTGDYDFKYNVEYNWFAWD